MSEPSVRKDRVAEATVSAVREKIPNLENAVLGREYFYHSLPLCVIDAVFSIGVLYRNAQKAVEAWCAVQYPNWPIARTLSENRRYTIGDFVRLTDGKQGLALTQTFFGGNRQRTSTRNGILKADATVRFAKALQESGIEDLLISETPLVLTLHGERSASFRDRGAVFHLIICKCLPVMTHCEAR